MTDLTDSVQFLPGVGPRRAEALAKVGIVTVQDLLYHLPRKHYDRGDVRPISGLRVGEPATVLGVVAGLQERRTRGWKSVFEVRLRDRSGSIPVVFFNQPYLRNNFRVGDTVIMAGTPRIYYGLQFAPTEYEFLDGEGDEPIHTRGWVPSYTVPDGFPKKSFRSLVKTVVEEFAGRVPEILPQELRTKRGLLSVREALRSIHFPEDATSHARAKKRLAYEEFFAIETAMALRRHGVKRETAAVTLRIGPGLDFRIRRRFPFKLTSAQDRVIGEIRRDLESPHPMNRLLQGDVGSGKTIVAAYALLAAVGNGAQAAIMAPTEILAEQHAQTFERLLADSRVRLGFLGGGVSRKERAETLARIASRDVDLVIGTHALLEEDVEFKKLGLVVIDEQQKFGVLQRKTFRQKGRRPHSLVMTATPIPRTLALTLFGDLDVSVIDELPPGRRPVKTMPMGEREAFDFIRRKIREGRQAYFVFPLIDESDKVPARSATEMHGRLVGEYPDFKVELLHGKLGSEAKEEVMARFRSGAAQVLVSTIVIEVGVDVPNASIMVIGNAERYGLSQLHQLRGRIGRGEHESHCIVFGEPKSEEARARLKAFGATTDGFRIAEADLNIRGPGDFLGTAQSGLPEFRAGNPVTDVRLLGEAKEDAFALVARDPELRSAPGLLEAVRRRYRSSLSLVEVG